MASVTVDFRGYLPPQYIQGTEAKCPYCGGAPLHLTDIEQTMPVQDVDQTWSPDLLAQLASLNALDDVSDITEIDLQLTAWVCPLVNGHTGITDADIPGIVSAYFQVPSD